MFQYIIKRILIFIPTLIIISMAIFFLNLMAPGDPVESMLNLSSGGEGGGNMADKMAGEDAYLRKRTELHLDQPVFYFAFTSQAYPDTLYRVPRKWHRENLHKLIGIYGNWPQISDYYLDLQEFEKEVILIAKDSLNPKSLIKIRENIGNLYNDSEAEKAEKYFANIEKYANAAPSTMALIPSFNQLKSNYNAISTEATKWKTKVPKFSWYGLKNQYHIWFSNFVQMDFGMSLQDKQPIANKIKSNILVTMIISFLSIILTYLIAIPLGIFSARNKGKLSDNISTTSLFILYSLPNFWIATLLIIYLCSPENLHWFPAYGLGEFKEGMNFFQKLGVRAYHIVLPLFCWTYGSLAFLSRQMRGGMLNVLSQDYIRTARAKGLEENKVIYKHAFRNSLLPIITIFGNVLPAMISGAIVIEVIFSLPGMGRMLLDAIVFKDYPVVFTLVLLTAFLTMLGYLIADILYAVVDPRISYK
ncbi:MAG: ABC transporter permease subunit [Chitinophagales bacterium]